MAILIKRDPNIEPLDPLFEEEVLPTAWNAAHVGLRVTEAFVTVLKTTTPGRRLGYVSTWPAILHSFDDLVGQQEQGELERTMQMQNHVRVAPTAQEIARMEAAIGWPMKYLSTNYLQLCEAVNAVSLAHAFGTDAGWVAKKRGGVADTWLQRHDLGCEIIARGLVADRTPVF
jgi:hypothetical protein